MKQLRAALPELVAIEELAVAAMRWGTVDELTNVEGFPIHAVRFGRPDRDQPVLLVTGGVHGVERIGTHVAIAFLTSLVARLAWDELLHEALGRARIIVVPLLNPIGMALGQRANGWGVDLMRNAPAPADFGTPLIGGHRLSSRLPWYMGHRDLGMEIESATLIRFVEQELFTSPLSIALDLHSGFGLVDRLWYPYARTREPPPDFARIEALSRLLDATLPNHVYKLEQTARVYTIRGDLWDYLRCRRRRFVAPYARDGIVELGAQESVPVLLDGRPVQSDQAASPSSHAAPPPAAARLPAPCGHLSPRVDAVMVIPSRAEPRDERPPR